MSFFDASVKEGLILLALVRHGESPYDRLEALTDMSRGAVWDAVNQLVADQLVVTENVRRHKGHGGRTATFIRVSNPDTALSGAIECLSALSASLGVDVDLLVELGSRSLTRENIKNIRAAIPKVAEGAEIQMPGTSGMPVSR